MLIVCRLCKAHAFLNVKQIGNWSRWLNDLFGIDDEDDDSSDENSCVERSFKTFNLLKALSDLMMLPKDMLLNSSVRKEVQMQHTASLYPVNLFLLIRYHIPLFSLWRFAQCLVHRWSRGCWIILCRMSFALTQFLILCLKLWNPRWGPCFSFFFIGGQEANFGNRSIVMPLCRRKLRRVWSQAIHALHLLPCTLHLQGLQSPLWLETLDSLKRRSYAESGLRSQEKHTQAMTSLMSWVHRWMLLVFAMRSMMAVRMRESGINFLGSVGGTANDQ